MRSALIASLLFVFPVMVSAQDTSPVPANCEDLVGQLGSRIALSPEATIEDMAGGCRVTGFYYNPDSVGRMKIGELSIVAPNLFDDWAAQRLPEQVDITLSGVTPSPDTGNALTSYIVEMQSEPVQMHLSYRLDSEEQTVELADLSVRSTQNSGVRLAGRFSNAVLDAEGLNDPSRLGVTLDQLNIQIDDARFLSSYLLPILVGTLPSDQDPRPLIADYIADATIFIESLPNANVSDNAKAVLVNFVQSFPRITGDYTFALRADPGIDMSEVATTGLSLADLLAGAKVSATHTPPVQP